MCFFYFKGTTHAHLLKASLTHNKNQTTLSNLLINYMPARSTPQILSLTH